MQSLSHGLIQDCRHRGSYRNNNKGQRLLEKNQEGENKSVALTECLNVLFIIIFVHNLYLYFVEVTI